MYNIRVSFRVFSWPFCGFAIGYEYRACLDWVAVVGTRVYIGCWCYCQLVSKAKWQRSHCQGFCSSFLTVYLYFVYTQLSYGIHNYLSSACWIYFLALSV